MKYLFDTDSCVYLMTGAFPALTNRVAECDEGAIGVSAISVAEMMLGSSRGKPPPDTMMEAFLSQILLLEFGEDAARAYARLPFKRGRYDRLIAAHALSLELTLITNNERDFADIPGLKVENWTL